MFKVPGWDLGELVVEKTKKKQKKKQSPTPGPVPATTSLTCKTNVQPKAKATKRICDAALPTENLDESKKKKKKTGMVREAGHEIETPAQLISLNQKPSSKAANKLVGARFRYLNQKLYESSSGEALAYFAENPSDFGHYHSGFREQTKAWPVNPVDKFSNRLGELLDRGRSKPLVVADLGCGEAQLARTFASDQRVQVHSFDLAAVNEHVTIASMTDIPLPNASVDLVIFSLALMNTDYVKALQDAHRILRAKGEIWIAEVSSRLDDAKGLEAFVMSLQSIGFKVFEKDLTNKVFIMLFGTKTVPSSATTAPGMASDDRLASYLANLHAAAEVPFDASRPIRFYVRAADSVFKQACIYKSEGDLEKSFILFLKFSNLVLKDLPRHSEYRNNVTLVAPLRGHLLTVLDRLEQTKPILLERFQNAEAERLRLEKREHEAAEAKRREDEAKEMAQRAVKTQEEARKQRLIEMQKLDMAKSYQTSMEKTPMALGSQNASLEKTAPIPSIPPLIPVSAATRPVAFSTTAFPVLDSKVDEACPLPAAPTASRVKSTCTFPGGRLLMSLIVVLENGMPLRLVEIPQAIVSAFLELAAANTRKNLETCGVLAGTLAHDVFKLTTLIVPKQTSTSDTVAMLNEEEIFAVQDQHDLLTLGWIHTHPTQQCFMSSVDLHTHFPYQLLMAEAIAIVVAPTQAPNYGIFRLTDPPGLSIISDCPQRGFHQHPSERSIYREISGHDGHAKMLPSLPLEIIDLRNKS